MPRYRLTQTQESAGRDASGMHVPPVVYWDCVLPSDAVAYAAACRDLPAPNHACYLGWSDGRLDWYDVPADRQRNGEGTHIATLKRVDQ